MENKNRFRLRVLTKLGKRRDLFAADIIGGDVGPIIGYMRIEIQSICKFAKEVLPIFSIQPKSFGVLFLFCSPKYPYLSQEFLITKNSIILNKLVPEELGFCSLQLLTTSSHVRSGRNRNKAGNRGFLLANRNPRCLKLTISPILGSHLFTNSAVPGTAVNTTPFGLLRKYNDWLKRKEG